MSSEIPVVLKPQGFAETQAGANAAAGSLSKLGEKVTSLDKLGETAKKIGPAALAMTAVAFAGRELGVVLERSLGSVVARATAASTAIIGIREAVRSARTAADNAAAGSTAGKAGALATNIAQGADPKQAAEVARDNGTTLDDAMAAQATGANLNTAALLRLQQGGDLAGAARKVAALGPAASRADPATIAATLANREAKSVADITTPQALTQASKVAAASPTVIAARKAAGVQAEGDLAALQRNTALPDAPRKKQVREARSPEVAVALEKAQSANRTAGDAGQRESQLLRAASKQSFIKQVMNAPSVWKALGSIDDDQATNNETAESATMELIRMLRAEGIKTKPVNRDAASQ